MLAAVEVHVFRDMKPRTRPSRGFFDLDGGIERIKLFPGAAAEPGELVYVMLDKAVRTNPEWFLLQATIMIDSLPLSAPRPIMLFYGVTDMPTGVAYYPTVSVSGKYAGVHSLHIRCVE